MLLFDKSSISLNQGYTLNDYIIKRNELSASYNTICKALKITVEEARAIYNRVYNIPIEAIGSPKKLETLKTGKDWRKPIEQT